MFKLKKIFETIGNKNQHDLKCLTFRLTNRNIMDLKAQSFLSDPASKKYLNTDISTSNYLQKKSLNLDDSRQKIRRRQNASEHSLYNMSKIKAIRNNSSNMHVSQGKDLQMKREKLMLQLKEVDLKLKNKHKQQYLSRIKRNKTEHEDQLPKQEIAVKLVQKMNQQRKQQMDKKKKQVLVLKQNVQESIRRFKEYQQQKHQQQLKKKHQIEKRIADRRNKAYERQKVNKVSDQIIKQLSSYKISLPDIYTRSKNNQIEMTPIILTAIDEEHAKTLQPRSSDRGKSFLQHLRMEDEQRVKQIQKKIQYQKHVRNMHLEYGKKQRLVIKSREKKLSKSRKKF